jgi:arabinan endo-1,5-alpha-L-arabinosidase
MLAALLGCTVQQPTPSPPSVAPSGTPEPAVATYRNPVFEHDAPDPTILHAPDGMYYVYTTQSIYLDLLEIPILQSRDLVHWQQVATAFKTAPSWVNGGPAGDMWAPHILHWRDRYLLYYAGRRLDGGDMAIGVGVASSARGPFHDVGHPILTKSGSQPDYTAIDPFVLADRGRLYLYWGSDNQPIRVARLSNDGLRVEGKSVDLIKPVPEQHGYGGLVEGAWVLPHNGFYYLMYSVGDCCSEDANYSVFVARARSPQGPFRPGPGNPILRANDHFWAVGHNATVRDATGEDWIVYHARLRSSPSDDRDLMLDRIVWTNGWPTVNAGRGPTWEPQPLPR